MDRLPPLHYYKWHWQKFRASRHVQRMDYIERGLYRDLLDECWVEGSIPNDIEKLADICDCPIDVMANAWHKLSKRFIQVDDYLINESLENERTEKDMHRVKMAIAGKQGGIKKSLNINDNLANASKSQALPSKSHIEEKSKAEKSRVKESKETSSGQAANGYVLTVFDYWKSVMNHSRANIDPRREKAIKARFKDGYSVADLCAAIDGCKRSPFNMGQNEQSTVYDDIELICRNSTNVDKFMRLSSAPDRTAMSDLARRNLQAAELWLSTQDLTDAKQ